MKGLLVGLLCAIVFAVEMARAEPLLTTTEGTSWRYEMVQEVAKGISLSEVKPDADGKVRLPVTYRIGEEQKIDGKSLRKFEMHRAGVLANTDVLGVDDHAITCYGRILEDGQMLKLDPPQKMLVAPLKIGTKWEYNGTIADEEIHQQYSVAAEEDVQVPAGKFHAFRVHIEQTKGGPMISVDRWFVPGVGFVKDVTEVKLPNGDFLQRIALELKELPAIAPRPEVKPTEAPKKLGAVLAKELTGESTTSFASDIPKIFVRWQGEILTKGDKIRCVWIAEDVGNVAPNNYKIDETSMTANGPRAFGTFTVSRPNKGWPAGTYRVELSVKDELVDTLKFTISK